MDRSEPCNCDQALELMEALRRVEWIDDGIDTACYVCGGHKPGTERHRLHHVGHAKDCPIAKALRG